MWIGALVLLMMIFRPAGLIPAKRRKAELTGMGSPSSSETHAVPRAKGSDMTAAPTAPAAPDAPTRDVVFDVQHVTLRFGGVTSLNDVSLQHVPRRDPGDHRAQRRRQDVAVQLA